MYYIVKRYNSEIFPNCQTTPSIRILLPDMKRNIKNHLFIVYAVINSVLRGENECIDINIYDLIKAFDVLWLTDLMNDL